MRTLRLFVVLSSPVFAGTQEAGSTDPAQFHTRVRQLQQRVAELAGTDDLLDTLHFGWFDRPYTRATLATLVKTTTVLQREVRLRERGNGAIPESRVGAMLLWTGEALERAITAEPFAGFRPHRLRTISDELAVNTATAPLYGLVDRTTATRYDERLGDLDLMAAMGFRVYPVLLSDTALVRADSVVIERAEALGMAVVGLTTPTTGGERDSIAPPPSASGPIVTVEPVTLMEMLQFDPAAARPSGPTLALTDPVRGESLAASLARRAFARGLWRHGRYIVDGWQVPRIRVLPYERSALTAAAMWVHAIEGQSLGLIRGWRDLRDGSGSPYRSILPDPAHVETIVRNALDLVRLRTYVLPFNVSPPVAVGVGPDAVDGDDANAWADWVEPVWAALLERQIRFDVVRLAGNDGQLGERYRVVFPLHRSESDNVISVITRLERLLTTVDEHLRRVTARELDGALAGDLFVRDVRTPNGRPCVAVVNLSARPRRIKLRGGPMLGPLRDVISNTTVERPDGIVHLEPWQVRLLWPAE
ncbi:MAG: hypothetical protein JSU86_04980 [Phycisphaerales bacterium]|nr:MAG: hypothetical protein JSU86_04980 [Phycisphaerales bacterium]